MLLTDLMHMVSRAWTPPAKLPGRLTMVIPSIRDINDGRQAEKVRTHCAACAQHLAAHLYVWRKAYPEKTTVKHWSKETQSFIGMNITDFQNFLMANFTLKTTDGREWLLDKSIGALIWESCVAADSPLPLASWQVERDLKRKEVRK
jgi:hypothetical protein